MQRGPGRETPRRGPGIAAGAAAGILVPPALGDDSGPFSSSLGILDGKPLISWSYEVLRDAGCRPVIVLVAPEDEEGVRAALDAGATLVMVAGSRRRSLLRGLDLTDAEHVVIHDAARPFATPDQAHAVLGALADAEGAVGAVPVNETLKVVEGGRVSGTIPREHLWHPQTPQAYRSDALRRACELASVDASEVEMVRAAGGRIALVAGSTKNIKVVSDDDLKLAEAIARAR